MGGYNITQEEKDMVKTLFARGISRKEIASIVKRNVSSISRILSADLDKHRRITTTKRMQWHKLNGNDLGQLRALTKKVESITLEMMDIHSALMDICGSYEGTEGHDKK